MTGLLLLGSLRALQPPGAPLRRAGPAGPRQQPWPGPPGCQRRPRRIAWVSRQRLAPPSARRSRRTMSPAISPAISLTIRRCLWAHRRSSWAGCVGPFSSPSPRPTNVCSPTPLPGSAIQRTSLSVVRCHQFITARHGRRSSQLRTSAWATPSSTNGWNNCGIPQLAPGSSLAPGST